MGSPPTPPPAEPATPAAAADAQQPQHPSAGLTFSAEHGLVGSRYIQFATRNIPPPGALYVTADDGLYINVSNIQAGQGLTFAAQFLLPDGRLQPNVWTINPPSTGSPTAYLFPLTEGFLFNLTCVPVGATRRGTTWVYAGIRRGSLASGVIVQTLLQDYVDSFSGPTWPGGQLKSSTDGTGLLVSLYVGNGPSNGTNYIFTVPAYARIRLRSIVGSFITNATVWNRYPAIFVYTGGNTAYLDSVVTAQVASKTIWYAWGLDLGFAADPGNGTYCARGLPDLILDPGDSVQIGASGILSGDQWQALQFVYEQWFSA